MRTRLLAGVVVLSGFALILAAQLGAFAPDEARAIPLNTIYATFNQEGLKSADEAMDSEGLAETLNALREAPPRVVLCVGSVITAAVKASAASYAMSEEPIPAVTGAMNDRLWLTAYLGSDGSTPPAYRIRAIEVKGKTIRVAYERDESSARSSDLRAYLVWAPMGPGKAGLYTLELFDVLADRVTLARPWQVTVK